MNRPTLPDPRNVRDGTPNEEKRIEALVNERVAAAVKAATEPLHAQINHLRSNRDAIIREKRTLEGRAFKEAQDREAERPQFVPYTREQGRDPATYRRLRAEAEQLGVPMKLVHDPDAQPEGEPTDVYLSETHYHVYGPRIKGDHAAFQAHKAEAERRGLQFHCAYGPAEMPKEAFQ